MNVSECALYPKEKKKVWEKKVIVSKVLPLQLALQLAKFGRLII